MVVETLSLHISIDRRRAHIDQFDRIREAAVPLLAPYGLEKLAVFGSYSRGSEQSDSDIDLFVALRQPRLKPLGSFTLARMESELSAALGRDVDLLTSTGVSRHMLPLIEPEMVVIYDRRP